MEEDSPQRRKTFSILGYSFGSFAVITAIVGVLVAWFLQIHIYWEKWLLYTYIGIVFFQFLASIFLKRLTAVVHPLLFILLICNVVGIFWFATYQKFVKANFDDYQPNFKDWKTENVVYVFLQPTTALSGTEAKVKKEDVVKDIVGQLQSQNKDGAFNKPGCETAVKIDGLTTKGDARVAWDAIKNKVGFSSHIKGGFVKVTGDGIAEEADTSVMNADGFEDIYEKRVGRKYVRGQTT